MLHEIGKKAIDRGTGARALRSLFESVMLDLMYELPSHESVREVAITAEVVRGEADPLEEPKKDAKKDKKKLDPKYLERFIADFEKQQKDIDRELAGESPDPHFETREKAATAEGLLLHDVEMESPDPAYEKRVGSLGAQSKDPYLEEQVSKGLEKGDPHEALQPFGKLAGGRSFEMDRQVGSELNAVLKRHGMTLGDLFKMADEYDEKQRQEFLQAQERLD